jgi:L-asparaginase/Glu-tRNA(Gln) amidotransferase subunit D
MPNKFEVRIDKIRLRTDGRNVPALQDKYIARAGGGAYMAVAPSEDGAIREVLRNMRMHYRRLGVVKSGVGSGSMSDRIMKALHTPCERVPGAANDIRSFPVAVLNS